MYLFIVCAMTNLVFSHNGIMYVVECSVCLSTDMYRHIKLELFDCCVLVFHRRRKCVSPKNVLHSFHSQELQRVRWVVATERCSVHLKPATSRSTLSSVVSHP